ncbi:hypothetical protein EUX98_g9183 [Antrodiella citrinella]|uniref:Uncharacterized protein n=1 Tax=Antrodiella citrinella TaxID=2447956 RepID=A0A4S4LX25_9APHY|nr:hypothetical protein EUX98_g9183 [Antrodiella citrinella]
MYRSTVVCEYCQRTFQARGIGSHRAKCRRDLEQAQDDLRFREDIRREGTVSNSSDFWDLRAQQPRADSSSSSANFPLPSRPLSPSGHGVDIDSASASPPDLPAPLPAAPAVADDPNDICLDDIRTEYHPGSGIPTKTQRFEAFRRSEQQRNTSLDGQPWLPFRTQANFEFAEIALDGALNRSQINALVKLFHRCINGQDKFTLNSYDDLRDTWHHASNLLTPFHKEPVVAEYKGEPRTFDMHFRPLWDWALDLLRDPLLAPHFVWDACRLSKFNGDIFERFYDEPWTADNWWKAQSNLPPGAKPLCFILYADKTKLSSFGTEQGYPVIARCANLPVGIHNGRGVGGGRVVGWLPIVKEDEKEKKKPTWINFKRVVWHKSFAKLLDSIKTYSKTGYWFECGDGINRHLFPLVLILSADYEEQCVMALIRGIGGKCPCPICLVPKENLLDITLTYPLRSTETMKGTYEKAHSERLAAEREAILKEKGLRDVENVFWDLSNSDPYDALSWERLHAFHGGLFGRHLWPLLKKRIELQGRSAIAQVDTQMAAVPPWRGLNHFNHIMSVTFNDGQKFEDISKLIIHASYNVFDEDDSADYLLLKCIRAYMELDIYLGLEVHTSSTLAAGRQQQLKFDTFLKEYATVTTPDEDSSDEVEEATTAKTWNFPKAHTHKHGFDDIEAKGVTRNTNAKPNEQMHGPLRRSYDLRSNKKEVAGQILKADHWLFVSAFIRAQLDEIDEQRLEMEEDFKSSNSEQTQYKEDLGQGHFVLGSKQSSLTFQQLEEAHHLDLAFKDFRKKLIAFMNILLPASGIALPTAQGVKFLSNNESTAFSRFILNL